MPKRKRIEAFDSARRRKIGKWRRFNGKWFSRGPYQMTKANAAKERATAPRFHVRRTKGPAYKNGRGHFYHIWYRPKPKTKTAKKPR